MKILFYSSKGFELPFLKAAASIDIKVDFIKDALSKKTVSLAKGYDAISIFTADDGSADVIKSLKDQGVRFIAIRAAGYDNVDIVAANEAEVHVANVPNYSPNAIAEHAVAMMLALNRKLIRSNEQVHNQNFSLDNLVGFDMKKKKVGIIGTGRIGSIVARILHGFDCILFAYDVNRNQELENKYNVIYTGLNTIFSLCDIVTIHVPLNDQTRYMVNKKLIDNMKRGAMLINTSRGGVLNTRDLLDALPTGHIGYFGMDVYEYEKGVFFHDRSGESLYDPTLQKLMTYSNVLITPHQAFATKEALANIADTTFQNLAAWKNGNRVENEITSIESQILS
jgi:D-lactate dehydrogenase